MAREREKNGKSAAASRKKAAVGKKDVRAVKPNSTAKTTSKPATKSAPKATLKPAPKPGGKVAAKVGAAKPPAKAPVKAAAKAPAKGAAKSAPKTEVRAAAPAKSGAGPGSSSTRPGLRFGSRDKPLSPLSLTPPPPPPPTKSPSRGKGITIIEPKRQAMKAALEAEKASKTKTKGSPKLDLANARSVAAVAMSTKADSHGYVVVNGRRVRVISTKAMGPRRVKKRPVVAAAATPQGPSEQDIQTTKTKLPKADLDHYREILLRHRRELVGRVTGLEDEALRSNGGNLSNMPLHPADIGTDTFDQDFALGMAASDRLLLQELDDALERISKQTYGVCQLTGKPIPKTRLDAKPWAKYTVEAARLFESGAVR